MKEQYDPSAFGTIRDKIIKAAAARHFGMKYGLGSGKPHICQELYLILYHVKVDLVQRN